ncbi:MAG: transporter associated domain-containing protein, partial [Myxococcota bacterium]
DEDSVQRLAPGMWTVQASLDLTDFHEQTGMELPSGQYHTVGGFVFHCLGRLPHRGDAFTHAGNRFVVKRMEGRRIAEVTVRSGTGSPVTGTTEGAS